MTEERPWGKYQILYEDETCKIKKITVHPKQKLSYQLHKQRRELWTVVEGRGVATLEGLTTNLFPGKSISIPKETKHRIQNDEDQNLIFIEIQTGTYFGEDDIVRFEDDYGRVEKND